jgi:hypothetical protein
MDYIFMKCFVSDFSYIIKIDVLLFQIIFMVANLTALQVSYYKEQKIGVFYISLYYIFIISRSV